MELLGKVRRMHYRDGLSRSEISRRTGLSRNTVRKWLVAREAVEPRYRRLQAQGKLGPFHAALVQAGYTRIHDLDYDNDGYWEADAVNSRGERVELRVDQFSGAVLRENRDD